MNGAADVPGLQALVAIPATATVAEAREAMSRLGVDIGVLLDKQGSPLRFIAAEQLAGAAAHGASGDVSRDSPEAVVVQIDERLADVVDDLTRQVARSDAPGVIVMDGDEVAGLLSRSTLTSFALTTARRRGGADRLPGNPVSELIFVCAEDGERQTVAFYDPDAPPRCKNGHLMHRVRA